MKIPFELNLLLYLLKYEFKPIKIQKNVHKNTNYYAKINDK